MFKSYYLVDFFQNQKWRYFDFEKNWLKNDQTLIKVKLRLKLVTCLIMTANLLLHMRQRALDIIIFLTPSIIAARLFENDNRASKFVMNICDNFLYVYNNYGFNMHKLHIYRLGIVSISLIVTCKSLIFVNIMCFNDLIFDFLELK